MTKEDIEFIQLRNTLRDKIMRQYNISPSYSKKVFEPEEIEIIRNKIQRAIKEIILNLLNEAIEDTGYYFELK